MTLSRRALLTAAATLSATAGVVRANAKPSAARFDLDRFIDDVKRARAETDSQRAVEETLARAVSNPAAIIAALGEPKEVGPQPLYRAPDLTILNLVWSPMMVLLPHNHLMWATIGIYSGREDNIIWERRDGTIKAARAASLSDRDVFSLPEDVVHSVVNPIRKLTSAIHIYGGDFFAAPRSEWEPETLVERPMDMEAARQVFRDAASCYGVGGG